ncbi:MAG: hypothetical protein K2L03_04935 [Bacteroidales bacterium]|nr:hypothetical protein [Bacteroidales bacterium]
MKPLKCALLLALGLMALSLRTPAMAQSASGQSKAVVPRHLQPLPDIDSLRQARPELFPLEIPDPEPAEVQGEPVHRGIPTPRSIEIMMDEGKFEQAVQAFTNYMDTVQGDPCDLIYLPYTFYNRLWWEDPSKAAFYQEKVDFYVDKFLATCGNTVEWYQVKEHVMNPKIPDSTVVWMTKAIALDSTVNRLYLMRGYALWVLQRTREACADFKKAAEMQNTEGRDVYNEWCLDRW